MLIDLIPNVVLTCGVTFAVGCWLGEVLRLEVRLLRLL